MDAAALSVARPFQPCGRLGHWLVCMGLRLIQMTAVGGRPCAATFERCSTSSPRRRRPKSRQPHCSSCARSADLASPARPTSRCLKPLWQKWLLLREVCWQRWRRQRRPKIEKSRPRKLANDHASASANLRPLARRLWWGVLWPAGWSCGLPSSRLPARTSRGRACLNRRGPFACAAWRGCSRRLRVLGCA